MEEMEHLLLMRLHRIWTVTDSDGNSDGIGSRYFAIQNTSSDSVNRSISQAANVNQNLYQEMELSGDDSMPVKVIRGFNENTPLRIVHPDEEGIIRIAVRELERVVIRKTDEGTDIYGCMVVGSRLLPLPISSTFIAAARTFYWQPGPGFSGEYNFIFIVKDKEGNMIKKNIMVNILTKFSMRERLRSAVKK
jgi:hypothetical protein